MTLPSKTFCILPFIHMATLTDGSATLCCVAGNDSNQNLNNQVLGEIWNSEYYRTIRKQFMNNQTPAPCTRCFNEEKHGYRSHRITENNVWRKHKGDDFIDKILENYDSETGFLSSNPIAIDLRLGNICNLQCIMCKPQESSRWLANAKKLAETLETPDLVNEWRVKSKIDVAKFEWYKNPEFWNDLKDLLPDIEEIIIAGGEPLLVGESLEFLEHCTKSGYSQNINLRYHTNASILPNEYIDLWKYFKKVELFFSIDGYSEINDYVRWPSKWIDVEQNLNKIDNSPDNITVFILYSCHALNMHGIVEFLSWLKEKNYKKVNRNCGLETFFHPGIVHYPNYLNPTVLPKEYKEKISNNINTFLNTNNYKMEKLRGVVNFMNSEDNSHLWNQTNEYCDQLDILRKTDKNIILGKI